MTSILIFVLGALVAILGYSKMYVLAIVVAIIALIFIVGIEKRITSFYTNNEIVIKKLCYIYVTLSLCIAKDTKASKAIRRTLKEIAVDVCGMGQYSLWIKWEAYFKKQYMDLMMKGEEE